MKRLVVVLVVAVVGTMLFLAGPAGAATDEEIAQAGTIQPNDLVSDRWFGSAADETESEAQLKAAKKLKVCKRYAAFGKSFTQTTDAPSLDLESTGGKLSNHSYVYADEQTATKAFALASAPGIPACFEALFTKQFDDMLKASAQAAAQVERFRVAVTEQRDVRDTVGDESVGYTISIEVVQPGGVVQNVETRVPVVRVGRVVLTYSHQFLPSLGPSDDLASAVDGTTARTRAALG